MPIIPDIHDLRDDMTRWRRELHQHPQTSYEENFAADFIAEKLTLWGIPFVRNLAKTGIVATITGQTNTSGKTLGLRADMDALDITEHTGLPHASRYPGKMHACGHDGHTATLLGTAYYLQKNRHFNGTVHLIFQPAEESGAGAVTMIKEGLFDRFPCDYVFALHNWPWLDTGKMGTRAGALMASSDEFTITITGKGGHAALPHKTIDPVIVAAQIIQTAQTIVSRNINPLDQAVISMTNIRAGTGASNIIPDTAHISGTVRTFRQDLRPIIKTHLENIVSHTAQAFGAEATCHYIFDYDVTVNSPEGVEQAIEAASDILGAENVMAEYEPTMGAEDFGAMLQVSPGAFVFMGQGVPSQPGSPHNAGLHTPGYDFNDDILPIGASYFARLVERYLASAPQS